MSRPPRHRLLTGAALLSLVALVALTRYSRNHRIPAPARSPRAPVYVYAPDDGRRPARAQALPPGLPSAAGFLADYYGSRWPEVEARIRAAGSVDLETPYQYRPWSEVAGAFEAVIGIGIETRTALVESKRAWPEPFSEDFLWSEYASGRPRRALTAAERARLQQLVQGPNAEIEALADAFATQLDARIHERWAQGGFLRAPFTTAGLWQGTGFRDADPDMGRLPRAGAAGARDPRAP